MCVFIFRRDRQEIKVFEHRIENKDSHLPNSLPHFQFLSEVACRESQLTRQARSSPSFLTSLTSNFLLQNHSRRKEEPVMAPPVATFPASDLPLAAQSNLRGRKRKGFDGDLKACELLEMLQYNCGVEEPGKRDSVVRCWPVVKLFRR